MRDHINHTAGVLFYWKALLKSMKRKLDEGEPCLRWADELDSLAAIPPPLRPEHVDAIRDLPPIHQDPCVTLGSEIAKCAAEHFRVLV